jgi:hypothetical protein
VGPVQSRIEDFGGLIRNYASYFAFVKPDTIYPCYLFSSYFNLKVKTFLSQSLPALTSEPLNDSGYKFKFLTVVFGVCGQRLGDQKPIL